MKNTLVSKKTKEHKKTSLISKLLTWFLSIFVFLLLSVEVMGFITARSNYGVSSIFGYQTMIVLTDSMDPTLPVGDGIIVQKVDYSTLVASTTLESHDGDIITFYRSNDGVIVTHRIIQVIENIDGTRTFRCLGDNLHATNCPTSGCSVANSDFVAEKYVLGKVIDVSPAIGKVHSFFSSPWITFFLVLVPLGLIFLSSLKDLIKVAKGKEEVSGDKDLDSEEFAEIKEKQKLEMLKEIEKEKMLKEIKENEEKR
ncbi:MAG: S26 family signal peptidase [Firmicutes bacterium]|nr:S26 family signal peptidase [Bacillota bacterium]